jgi:serine/threonine protein phosphatase 1
MEVLRDMSLRANTIPIVGNHEYFALTNLKELLQEITEENVHKIAHDSML